MNGLRYGYTPVMASVSVILFLTATLFSLAGRLGNLLKLLGADTDG